MCEIVGGMCNGDTVDVTGQRAYIVTIKGGLQVWGMIFVHLAKKIRYDAGSEPFIFGETCVVSLDQISSSVTVILKLLAPRLVRFARKHQLALRHVGARAVH